MMIRAIPFVLFLSFLLSTSVTARNRNVIPCSEAGLEPADDIVNVGTGLNEEFPNFPCGKYPFTSAGPQESLKCNYNIKFKEYECVSDITPVETIIDAARDAFKGDTQPCTAKGYKLDQVANWWWLCVKE
mmetsp:Transcript_9704/g.17089  ORF Transcript_9704/g.17089 Transcript_9704/m.17089 type:complete len:130 (-) Transcript_9704:824-1213(-)